MQEYGREYRKKHKKEIRIYMDLNRKTKALEALNDVFNKLNLSKEARSAMVLDGEVLDNALKRRGIDLKG